MNRVIKQEVPTSSGQRAVSPIGFGQGGDKQSLPVGTDNFREVREANCYYVDKTLMIKDFIETGSKVTLITRPRRFGKTLNMTMIREFFDITKDSGPIFDGLAIMQTEYACYINSRPVIYFSFKTCSAKVWPDLIEKLKRELYNEYKRYRDIMSGYLMQNPSESVMFDRTFHAILDVNSRAIHIEEAIKDLTATVAAYYGIKPILLIDEYDQPIMSSYERGYHDQIEDFFSNFYGSAMKGNDSLERALLTGVQKIAQESIFSRFNNVDVYTVLNKQYSQYFGLTTEETETLLHNYDLELDDNVRKWYDGYVFSGVNMYNPWSTLNYARKKSLASYWSKTGSSSVLKKLLGNADKGFWTGFGTLISTKEVAVDIVLETVYADLGNSVNLWGLLLNAGYVTAIDGREDGAVTVKIPNNEVMNEFKTVIASISGTYGKDLNGLFGYLLGGEVDKFLDIYRDIVLSCTSYMDAAENAYHMLFLGMAMYLRDSYEISSNRESGYGRYGIQMKSLQSQRQHVVIEFKQGNEF